FNLGVNAGCYDDQNLQAVLQSLSSELYSVNTTSNVNLNITNGKTTNTIPAINTLNKSNIINIADVPSNSTMNEITKGAINFYQASDYFHFCTQSNNACESGFADPNSVNSWSDGSTTLGWANRGTAVHKFNKLIGYFKEMSIDIDEIIAEIGAADARDTILYDINDLKTIKTPLDAKYTEAKTFFDGKGYKSCTADSCDKAPEKIYGGMKVMDDMLNKLTIDDQVYKIGDTYTTFADDLKNVYVTYLKQTKAALNDNVYWGKKVTDHPVSYNTEDGKYPFTYKDNIAYTNPYTEDSYKSLIFNATGTEVNLKCHPYQFAKNDAGCESTVFFRKDNDSVGQYKFANYFINKDENPNLTFAAFKSNADTINTFNSDSTNAVNKFSGFDGTVTTNKSLAELEQNIAAVHNRFLAIILNKGVIHLFKNAGDVLLSEIDLNKLLPKDTITTINKTLAFGYAFQMIGKLGESLGTDLDGKPHYLAQNGRAMEMKNYDPEHKVVLPSQLSTAQDPEPTIPGTDALQGDLGLEVLSTILGLAGFIADLFGGDFFGSNNINNLLITSYIASNFADMSYNGDKNNASYKEKINQGGGLTPAQNTTCDKLLSHADVSCSTDEEYIIYGSEGQYSPKTPFVMIFCMRIALDMIGTYQNSEINAMMKPIESAFPPFGYIVATLLRFGIAILEASADMSTLINDGNPVAMFKGSDSKDWSVLGGNAEYLTKGMKCSSACATYQNFLELFTLLKLSNQGSTKANMMKRMADVIQANYYYSKVKTKSVVDRWWADKYRILYADTDLQIRGKYEIKPFFMNFGFLGQLTGDPNRTSLMNFRVSNVAGY
ncbi:MAG: DUF5702 domain-containing protein, partial [Bifidobacteriaceae bacterium]|nr:DUF5702 domain-containing protein [Bifidobacteriaceae bacterium]